MVLGKLPVVTRSLLLRPLALEDADVAYALSNEEPARKWLSSQVYRDVAHASSVVQFLIRQQSDPGDPRLGAYVLAIERKAQAGMIGHVGLSPLDRDVEVGFGIALAYQRRGFASEAVAAMCAWAFEAFHLPRIIAVAAAENTASCRTLVNSGFVHQETKLFKLQGAEQMVDVYARSHPELYAREA